MCRRYRCAGGTDVQECRRHRSAGVQECRRPSVGQTQDKTPAACFHQIIYASPFSKHLTNIRSFDSHVTSIGQMRKAKHRKGK